MSVESQNNSEGDEIARERIRHSLDESLLVEAAAGTGKTTELIGRLVEVLAEGKASVHQIVAVTFTRKAAGELKLRLRQALDRSRLGSKADRLRRLDEAISHLEEARIGTIHSFCAEILRELPVEAEVDPNFGELEQADANRLFARAFHSWIGARLEEGSPTLDRALSRLAARSSSWGSPMDQLLTAASKLREWRDFPAPWPRPTVDREKAIDALMGEARSLAQRHDLCTNPRDNLRISLDPVKDLVQWLERAESLKEPRDYDNLEARFTELLRELKRPFRERKGYGTYASGISRSVLVGQLRDFRDRLASYQREVNADLAAALQEELGDVLVAYEELKRREGSLDFLDLLLKTRALLRDHRGARQRLQDRFAVIFVDEFQDTDPLQMEILLLLTADDPATANWREVRPTIGKAFFVGDPKQSIYRFRRADVLLYQEVKQIMSDCGVGVVELSRNFRSTPDLQEFVNTAFGEAMKEDRIEGQPAYVPLVPFRKEPKDQASVVALPIPRPYGPWGKVTGRQVEAESPTAVAAYVAWLIEESGWTVGDPDDEGARIPIQPRHICLLFRRFLAWGRDTTRPFVEALEDRGIAHLLVGGRSFHQREEVETLSAALTAIEWPDDELAVYATLKGALFSLSDETLYRWRCKLGAIHPFRHPESVEEELEDMAGALAFLADLHRRRNHIPVVQTVQQLLNHTRAHAGFVLRPSGQEVVGNVHQICELARSFESGGGLSFRRFVERLHEEAEQHGVGQAPVREEGAEGVRLMTLHTAKGLEFPVVVTADITTALHRKDPDHVLDARSHLCAFNLLGCRPQPLIDQAETEVSRMKAEGIRVAYVAATRARDLLVVPVIGDGPFPGWVGCLNPALYPDPKASRDSQSAAYLPAMGAMSVLERPSRAAQGEEMSVRPGLHRAQRGQHSVIWWDPALLQLGKEQKVGLQRESLLVAKERSEEGRRGWREWVETHERRIGLGSEPSRRVDTVSSFSADPPGRFKPMEIEGENELQGAHGKRFGTLVHRVLECVEFGSPADLQGWILLHGRLLKAKVEEEEAALHRLRQALDHPLMKRAAVAETCYRELPLCVELNPGHFLEGTVDLLYRWEEEWILLDFKTDQRLESLENYRRQLRWYQWMLSRQGLTVQRSILFRV